MSKVAASPKQAHEPLSVQSPPSAIEWLLAGDVSVCYQALRDLCGSDQRHLRERIAREGWGAALLARRNADGSWGRGFYQPKWISSHYTLLDLKMLNVAPDHAQVRDSIDLIVRTQKKGDGGIGPGVTKAVSDVCVNGMFLNYASYFGAPLAGLKSVVDFILDQRMDDGGFNCQRNRGGARHSSLHSTICVLEGIAEYAAAGHRYRLAELEQAAASGREFMLLHRLFKSDHTGNIIHKDFLRLSYPPRWKYNILRALDYFRAVEAPWDDRLQDAVDILLSKRTASGRWLLQAPHPGEVHFTMEQARQPSRWNTLLALRVLRSLRGAPLTL
jgi:hypothetical protein